MFSLHFILNTAFMVLFHCHVFNSMAECQLCYIHIGLCFYVAMLRVLISFGSSTNYGCSALMNSPRSCMLCCWVYVLQMFSTSTIPFFTKTRKFLPLCLNALKCDILNLYLFEVEGWSRYRLFWLVAGCIWGCRFDSLGLSGPSWRE